MEEKLDLILSKLQSFEVRFDKIDEKFSYLEKEIHAGFCKAEDERRELSENRQKNRDKILSAVDEFVKRGVKNEEEITMLAFRQRNHEERIEALEEKVG